MAFRFHTAAAVFVLVAAGAWVLTGKYSFVGSELVGDDKAETAQSKVAAPVTPVAAADALQTVAFAVAKPAPYVRGITLSGHTEADKQVVLVARTSGVVARLSVVQGAALAADELVMALDGPEKLAAVVSAQAQFDIAEHQAETNQQLRNKGSLSVPQLEASVSAREAARSALESAKAEVGRLEVRAPFTGVVDTVIVEVGSWVQPGTEVASLLALDPIVVVGEINERDLQSVAKGAKARVIFGDGTVADGLVRYVWLKASGVTRTFPIEVAITNPSGKIPAGMSAEIELQATTAPAVVLPRSVITLDTEGSLGVRVLTDKDAIGFLKVTIVDDTPAGLVLADIPAGTRIVVSGQNMVNDGQQVIAVAATDAQLGSVD